MPCVLGDLTILVQSILNVLNSKMGRPLWGYEMMIQGIQHYMSLKIGIRLGVSNANFGGQMS